MTNAVIYARFSSDKQDEASIDAQVRACREYAAARGLQVVQVYADEAVSGKGSRTAHRHQYQRMIRDAGKGAFSVILIHKYDRIARNLGEHVTLEAKLHGYGVRLIATAQDFGDSNEAKIMRALMWSLSEYYIDNLAQETRKGLRETALKGLHTGGYPPFGYDVVDQRYVVNQLEAGYVRKMFAAAQARKGFTALIREMGEAGITGKRGKPIKYPQIYEILRNEKYTGVYTYSPKQEASRGDRRDKPNAIKIENALPIIIDKAQFQEVQEVMRGRKQTGKKVDYLCSGLVYCRCGAKMHARVSKGKGHVYHYFYCPDKCGTKAIRMELVEHAAIDYLHDLLSEANHDAIAASLREYQAGEGSRMLEFKQALWKRIARRRKEYNALLGNLSSGTLPLEIVADIGQRMQEIKAEIATLEATEPPEDFTTDTIKGWLNSIKAAPDEAAVRMLVERMDLKRDENKTDFNITSTLKSVLRKNGCGGSVDCFPQILFRYILAVNN